MANLCTISDFEEELRTLGKKGFTLDNVHQFLKDHPIEPESLRPYLFFRTSHYTRNLIDKTELYEVIAICWEPGHKSQVHNHKGQNCWMAVPIGNLLVQNYKVVAGNPNGGHCELAESDRYWMDPTNPGRVEPEEPIHYVANPPELKQQVENSDRSGRVENPDRSGRAVSIHIYSYPYDSCMVYSLEQKKAIEIPLHYTSEYGVLEPEEMDVG